VITFVGLLVCLIVSIVNSSGIVQSNTCQETVVAVEAKGHVLARCPAGTSVEIFDDSAVICRCPQPSTETPDDNEPPAKDDPGATWL
jgi:hypothetical protein